MSGGLVPESRRGSVHAGFVETCDWYRTFCGLAGVDPADARGAAAGLPPVEGFDLWPVLSGANETSPRSEVVIGMPTDNTDVFVGVQGVIDSGGYKLLIGVLHSPVWTGPQCECPRPNPNSTLMPRPRTPQTHPNRNPPPPAHPNPNRHRSEHVVRLTRARAHNARALTRSHEHARRTPRRSRPSYRTAGRTGTRTTPRTALRAASSTSLQTPPSTSTLQQPCPPRWRSCAHASQC